MTSAVQVPRLARYTQGAAVLGRVKGRLRRPLRGYALDSPCAGKTGGYAIKAHLCWPSVLWNRSPGDSVKVGPSEPGGDKSLRRLDNFDRAPYHAGWTSKRFDEAIKLLAPDLKVEVPINAYPTRESFADALASFGGMVERVGLLAEFANGSEAMLLYDMEVKGLGRMRVAEHFTVNAGKITRLRQIHDTAAVRAAGFARNS
jgi:hypothetical protein